MKKRIWCFIGPSASGKTTLVRKTIKGINAIVPNTIGEVISVTTREPRKGEVNGVDYFFLTKKEFSKLDLAEHAEYAGNSYGITKDEVTRILSNYKNLFVVVSIDGYNQLKKTYGDEVGAVFLECPKYILERRLQQRGDSPELIQNRLENMDKTKELDNGRYCDYTYINLWPYRTDDETYHEFLGLCINKLKIFEKFTNEEQKKETINDRLEKINKNLEFQSKKYHGVVLVEDDVHEMMKNKNIEFEDLCKELSTQDILNFGEIERYQFIGDIYFDKEEFLVICEDNKEAMSQVISWIKEEYNCDVFHPTVATVYVK